MLTTEAVAALEAFVAARGGDLYSLDADAAVDTVVSWYQIERADDVADLGQDGDMLLFQWGTHDLGEGLSFRYDITRQFMVAGEQDDDEAIWQLSVTLHYSLTEQTRILGSGNRWCNHPAETDAFRRFIEASSATAHARATVPERVDVGFGQAG